VVASPSVLRREDEEVEARIDTSAVALPSVLRGEE